MYVGGKILGQGILSSKCGKFSQQAIKRHYSARKMLRKIQDFNFEQCIVVLLNECYTFENLF